MNKQPQLKKSKYQKNLTDLWDGSMSKNQKDSKIPSLQKPTDTRNAKKQLPPNAEKLKLKRSFVDHQKETVESTHNCKKIRPKSKENVEIDDHNRDSQLGDNHKQTNDTSPKVKLTPELLELHRMLNKDWSKKLDQKLDPLETSVNEIKSNLTTQETKIEQVMKIKEENIKLHN